MYRVGIIHKIKSKELRVQNQIIARNPKSDYGPNFVSCMYTYRPSTELTDIPNSGMPNPFRMLLRVVIFTLDQHANQVVFSAADWLLQCTPVAVVALRALVLSQ